MSNAKEMLDKVFSIYIRRRDCRDGTGRCISCGRPITFTTCDAGHYIPRTHTATRWNIYNVNAQCRECNRMKDGNASNYRIGLIERYGLPVVDKLEQERHATVKLSDNDYRTLTRFFKQQTAKL